MATTTLHNVKTVQVHGSTHDDFCTLKLDVMTQYGRDGREAWERLEFFFDTTDDRKAFVEAISAGGF